MINYIDNICNIILYITIAFVFCKLKNIFFNLFPGNSNRNQTPKRCRIYDRNVKCPNNRNPQPHTLCSMYYDCTDGRACAKQCPVGLYFNRTSGICDLPMNVKCFIGEYKEIISYLTHQKPNKYIKDYNK